MNKSLFAKPICAQRLARFPQKVLSPLCVKQFITFLIALAAMTILTFSNVVTRYVFNFVLAWSEELATSCFVYTVFIGAAWCLRTRQHVGVDLLVERLPVKKDQSAPVVFREDVEARLNAKRGEDGALDAGG